MAAPAVAPKAAAAGPAAESLAETVPEVIRRVTLWNPLILSGFVWAAGCAANAVWHAPEAPLTSPELLQEQLQRRIMSIPIPSESPRYQQYKQYYLLQHDQQMVEYNTQFAIWQQSNAQFNWKALFQGLGVGVMVFSAIFACLEYHYGAISYWMEASEELWWSTRERWVARQARLRKQADSRKMEKLLAEMGEGEEQSASKSLSKRNKKPQPMTETPAPAATSKVRTTAAPAVPASPAAAAAHTVQQSVQQLPVAADQAPMPESDSTSTTAVHVPQPKISDTQQAPEASAVESSVASAAPVVTGPAAQEASSSAAEPQPQLRNASASAKGAQL
ncbi:unnamed protein product, partial [Polarella glacialis]